MKLAIFFAAAAGLALIGNGLADQYDNLAAQGYRWVNVNGPYACTSEQHVEGLVAHRTDARELEVVQNIQCYYLIPGTIVQVIKEDPAQGMTEMRVAGRPRYLWTYTRFLSKRPIQDTYGVIQTPQNSGLRGCLKSPDSRQIVEYVVTPASGQLGRSIICRFCEVGIGRTFQTSSHRDDLTVAVD